jgi:TRAP-type C4-dicarboxylate transport system substrate-binding protein
MKKKSLSISLLLGLIVTLIVTPATAAKFKARKLRVSSPWIMINPNNVAFEWAWKRVTEKTDGAVRFEGFYGGTIGTASEHLDLVSKGIIDIAQTNRMYTIGKTPLGQYDYSIPFTSTDPAVTYWAKRTVTKEFPVFQKILAKYNCMLLDNIPVPPYKLLSNKPIQKLADFKGQKIAVIGKFFGKWMEPVGMVPVVCGMPDRYGMFQSGVLDMDLLYITEQVQQRFIEYAKYSIEAGIGNYMPVDCIINLDTWNDFEPELKKIFYESLEAMVQKLLTEWIPRDLAAAEEQAKKEGVAFMTLTADQKAKWAAMVPDTAAQFAAEAEKMGYPEAWDIVARYQELVAEKGYKWPRKWGLKP